jgi:transcriptional regulator GlxA family with amidase domain
LNPKKQLIGSICPGSFIFSRLGLLAGIKATIHPDAIKAFGQSFLLLIFSLKEKPRAGRGTLKLRLKTWQK